MTRINKPHLTPDHLWPFLETPQNRDCVTCVSSSAVTSGDCHPAVISFILQVGEPFLPSVFRTSYVWVTFISALLSPPAKSLSRERLQKIAILSFSLQTWRFTNVRAGVRKHRELFLGSKTKLKSLRENLTYLKFFPPGRWFSLNIFMGGFKIFMTLCSCVMDESVESSQSMISFRLQIHLIV